MQPADTNAPVYDLPPGAAGPWRFQSVLLPREGIFWLLAAAVMFVTGLYKGINLLVLLAYLLFGLWVINLWLVERDLRRLRARRRAPDAVFAGRATEFEIDATLVGARLTRGLTVVDTGRDHQRRWLVLRMAGAQTVRLRHTLTLETRGRYPLAVLQAQSLFPFGLVGRAVELAPAEEWIVLPRLGRLDLETLRRWLARATRGDGRTRVRHTAPSLSEADIHGLREFRPGDSPRWIHWRSTARRNQVLVREFEQDAPPAVTLVVEPWLPAEPTDADRERLERLLSLAATVCHDWARDPAAALGVVVLGREPATFGPGNGWEYACRVLECLSVQPGDTVSADPGEHVARFRGAAPALILTSRPDSHLPEAVAILTGRAPAVVLAGQRVPWYECPFAGTASPPAGFVTRE